ncbi:MAG: hypothetical protein IPM91_07190 [Bacteroidetes bacterium]|nr:hypothetical protein [Bacteroidota bacterium]
MSATFLTLLLVARKVVLQVNGIFILMERCSEWVQSLLKLALHQAFEEAVHN